MTITHNNADFELELLPNGIISTYDYRTQQQLSFHQVDGKWVAHNSVARLSWYAGLTQKINERLNQ